MLQTTSKEASFADDDSSSSESTPVANDSARQYDQDHDLLEDVDQAELWRIHTEDLCWQRLPVS